MCVDTNDGGGRIERFQCFKYIFLRHTNISPPPLNAPVGTILISLTPICRGHVWSTRIINYIHTYTTPFEKVDLPRLPSGFAPFHNPFFLFCQLHAYLHTYVHISCQVIHTYCRCCCHLLVVPTEHSGCVVPEISPGALPPEPSLFVWTLPK